MNRTDLNELMLKVDKVCFSDEFKKAFTDKFNYFLNGITYFITEENGWLYFILTVKNENEDLYKYNVGDTSKITPEIELFVEEYFRKNEKSFYNTYMKNAEIV